MLALLLATHYQRRNQLMSEPMKIDDAVIVRDMYIICWPTPRRAVVCCFLTRMHR